MRRNGGRGVSLEARIRWLERRRCPGGEPPADFGPEWIDAADGLLEARGDEEAGRILAELLEGGHGPSARAFAADVRQRLTEGEAWGGRADLRS